MTEPRYPTTDNDPRWVEALPARIDRCYLCHRREVDMNATLDGAVRGLCDTCWERGQDEIRIPLDYTTDEGDDDG